MPSTDDIADQAPGVIGRKLAGRVALVTGGTRGIGAAICTSLASEGAVLAASKSGLLGLTKALARETAFLLARSGRLTPDTIGLTVNAVAPGLIATEMLDSVPGAALARLTTQIPCGRLGRPEEVARIVHVLAADASS